MLNADELWLFDKIIDICIRPEASSQLSQALIIIGLKQYLVSFYCNATRAFHLSGMRKQLKLLNDAKRGLWPHLLSSAYIGWDCEELGMVRTYN